MAFEKHLRSVSRAASQRLGILRKSWRVFHDRSLFGRCFQCFVLPVLEYLWHMAHGIDLPAPPNSNYSCYLLYEQPSLARIHSFTRIHFYCSKRLLGRNNTATASAPHERCQHLFNGALLLSYNATDSRLFLRFFLLPMVVLS